MTGRPCLICSNNAKMAKAAELILAGSSDQSVANTLSAMTPNLPPLSEMAVSRHRRNHILKVAQDRLAIASKGAAPREERKQIAKAAAADTPTVQEFVDAFFGLKAQAEKLQRIEDRLERMAALAESNESATGVAALAGNQLRAVETGAKLVGTGGFATPKMANMGGGPLVQFTIQYSGAPPFSISATPVEPDSIPDAPERANTFAFLEGIKPSREVIPDAPDQPDDEEFEFDDDV